MIYGAGHSAGIVRFERDKPDLTQATVKGNASLTVGSNDHRAANLNLTAGDTHGYLQASASRDRADDYDDGHGQRVRSAYMHWNAQLTAGWTPDADTRVELSAGRGNGRAAYAFASMDGVQFKRDTLSLEASRTHLAPWWSKLELSLYDNRANHIMDNYALREPDPSSMMPMAMAANLTRRSFGGRLAATLTPSSDWSIILGGDAHTDTHHHRSGGPRDSMSDYHDLPLARDARIADAGLFAQATWQLDESQRLVGGIRADRAQMRAYQLQAMSMDDGSGGMAGMGTSMAGNMDMSMSMPATGTVAQTRHDLLRAGFLRYETDANDMPVHFYAGLGHSEREPDYWELLGDHADSHVSDFLALRPERTTQLDIGARWQGERFKAWVSAYAGRVGDYIVLHFPATGMSGAYASNVNARIAGGEAGLDWQGAHWSLDSALSYAWGRNDSEHRPLPQMPPLKLKSELGYRQGAWQVHATWTVASAQHRDAVGEGTIVGADLGPSAGYGVLGLNATVKLDTRWQLAAGIDNVLDKTYAEHVNAAPVALAGYIGSDATRIKEPGRTACMRVNLHF